MAGFYTTIIPVVSSNLAGAGWTEWVVSGQWTSFVEIEFRSGSLYLYRGVSQRTYDSLMAAPSKGKYFWANIRRKPYRYWKLR
jgi:hypothetical protein